MPLSKHDAEEQTRQLDGAVIDAAESAGESRILYTADATQFNANLYIANLNKVVNRQAELIARLREQVRQAIS